MLAGLTFGSKKELEKQFREESELEKAKQREERKLSKKQKKESKKHKKEKHKKDKRKGKHDSSDSEPSSGPEDAWQQQQGQDSPGSSPAAADRQPALQREDWMTVPMARSFMPQPDQQAAKPADKTPEEAPIVAGIRYMKPEQAAAAAAREEERRKAAEAAAASCAAGPAAGAAGLSWRVKALQRAQQLAKEGGKDLNEVLSERWGSAAEIAKGIMDNAAAAHQQDQGSRNPQQRHAQQQQQHGSVPHYLSSVRSDRGTMMKPPSLSGGAAGSRQLSWRRPAAGGSSREADREQHQRDREGDRERDRDRQQDREREQRRDHDRAQGREGNRHRQQHQRDDRHDRDREQIDRDRRRGGDHDRGHRPDPAPDRRGGGDHRNRLEGGRDGRGEEGDLDSRGRGSYNRREGDRQPGRRPQQQQQQQDQVVEALKAVAGSINTFSNDGSFLQQFQQQPDQQEHQQRSGSPGSSMEQDDVQLQQQRLPAADTEGQAASAPKLVSADGTATAAGDNRSKADLLRAKLGGKAAAGAGGGPAGNRSAADALRARLGGKAAPPAAAAGAGAEGGHEVVHLPLVDAAGRAAPGAFGRETAADAQRALEAAAGGRVAKRVQRYGADGTRERYFADDDSTDLQTLVKRAKYGDDGMDIDRALMSNIAKRARFKEADLDPDAEYDYDAGVDLSDSRRRRGDVQQAAARERQRQVAQFNRQQRQEDKCNLCFKSAARNPDLTIAVGQSSYLSLLPRGKLVDGHCCIVTQEHTPSMRQVDDDTWSEVRNWQKCLINMFLAQGKQVIFMETAMGVGTARHHALLEAIPVDEQVLSRAPMYFKKAMEEAESEWSQHAAKAAIPTRDKGLRGSIPANFPYLYVQFGPSNGYVHVIDDEHKFDKNLGRQVLVGLLKLPAEVMHRKPSALEANTVKKEAAVFRKQFSPFF